MIQCMEKVIIEAGDSLRFKQGQIVSARAFMDENSILKRSDKKSMQKVEMLYQLFRNQYYRVLQELPCKLKALFQLLLFKKLQKY